MRALVTGAGGFAGQHLIRELLAAEIQVSGGALHGSAPPTGVLTPEEIQAVRWLPLDVTSSASLDSALESASPNRIFHLAGQSSVGGSFADPMGTWDVNATGTLRLMEAARAADLADLRVLVVSSAEVYGSVPEARQPIREEEPLRPMTPYGASKMAAEAAALQAAGGKNMVVVARSFNHAGPGQDGRFVLPNLARQLAGWRDGDDPPTLRVGNLEPLRDFLDVRDVARAYVTLLEHGVNGEVYNVASGEARTMTAIVEELIRLSGSGARIEIDSERFRPIDIPLLVGDASKLRGLGWSPQIELAQTLGDLMDSVRDVREPSTAPGASR